MAKFHVSATVVGSTYIGEFEAETDQEAIDAASTQAHVSMCHQCSKNCENIEITEFSAEPA
jgi:hypothetical protein